MKRILLLATTTGYQTRMFGEAAARLGVRLAFATDRCDQIEDPWWDAAIPIRFHDEAVSVQAILRSIDREPVDGLLVVGDRPTVIAALVARAAGLPGHAPEAAETARNKRLSRERLREAALPVPWFTAVPLDADTRKLAGRVPYPCVLKPTVLSGSRGVIRADGPDAFVAAFERIGRLLSSVDVQALRDEAAGTIQIEGYIAGREYALEGVLEHGVLRTLAIFDKPDPLEGPFFEETMYVTPAHVPAAVERRIVGGVVAAARALGLFHGPVHAECRVAGTEVFVLEIAARPIGGLCARSLSFAQHGGASASFEELLLRHAVGESLAGWLQEERASGVMMIPIPRGGVYRGVEGLEEAARVPGVWDVVVTAKPGQELVPLPEGASYLGFIFAKAETPGGVEAALREAHARLRFLIATSLSMAGGRWTHAAVR